MSAEQGVPIFEDSVANSNGEQQEQQQEQQKKQYNKKHNKHNNALQSNNSADAEMLKREKQLRQNAQAISEVIDQLKQENDKLFVGVDRGDLKTVTDSISKVKQQLNELNAKIQESEKNNPVALEENLAKQLDSLKAEVEDHNQQREKFGAEKKLLENQLTNLKTKVNDLKKKLPYTSIMDYDREISRLKNQLEAKTPNPNTKPQDIKNRIAVLEKSKTQYMEYYEMWEKYVTEQKRYQSISTNLDKIYLDLKNKLAQQEDYSHSLKQLKDSKPKDDLPALKKKRDELRKELTTLKEKKQSINDAFAVTHHDLYEKRKDLKSRMEVEKKKRQAVMQDLDQLKSLLVSYKFSFDPANFSALGGKSGNKIDKIRGKTKAEVIVIKQMGTITVRGTKESADAAKEEVEKLLAKLKNVISVRVRPEVADYISTQQLIDLKYNCNVEGIFLDKLEGTIKIVGSEQNVKKAKQAVEQFIADSTFVHASVPVNQTVMNIVFSRSGEYIRRMRDKSGVAKMNVNPQTNTLELEGTKKSVEDAKKAFEKFAAEMTQPAYETKVDRETMGAVIGKSGSRIRQLEGKTGAMITVDKQTSMLVIRGSKKCVDAAKRELAPFVPALASFKQEKQQQQKKNVDNIAQQQQPAQQGDNQQQQPQQQQQQQKKQQQQNQQPRTEVVLKDGLVCGAIIGPSGSVVIAIEKETNTKITVNKYKKRVFIAGATTEACAAAAQKVQAVIDAFYAQKAAEAAKQPEAAEATISPAPEQEQPAVNTQ